MVIVIAHTDTRTHTRHARILRREGGNDPHPPEKSQKYRIGERSGSVEECLTRDRRAAGSSLTGVTVLCP